MWCNFVVVVFFFFFFFFFFLSSFVLLFYTHLQINQKDLSTARENLKNLTAQQTLTSHQRIRCVAAPSLYPLGKRHM